MKQMKRGLSILLSVLMLLSLLPATVLAAEEDPWAEAVEVRSLKAFQEAVADEEVTAIRIAADIEISENMETDKNIQVATGAALTIAEDACLIQTGELYRYEDVEKGEAANMELLSAAGIYFLYAEDSTGIYRELYGSAEKAAAALLEREWMMVVLPGEVTLESDEEAVCKVYMLQYFGDIILGDNVTLDTEVPFAGEGCDVIREVETLEEMLAADQEECVTMIRVMKDMTITAVNGVGVSIGKAVEAAEGVDLTISAGEFGGDVSAYIPEGYICTPLRKEDGNNGFEERGNLVDDVHVVYKKVESLKEMLAAEADDTVGAIYMANDIAAHGGELITKPLEIGAKNSEEHYSLTVTGSAPLVMTSPFQRFGFENIGRVATENFKVMSEDGIQWLMRGNETRYLYGDLFSAERALNEAEESGDYYTMIAITGNHSGAPAGFFDIYHGDGDHNLYIMEEWTVTGMMMLFGDVFVFDKGTLVAENILIIDGLAYREDYYNKLEGYNGESHLPGNESSYGGPIPEEVDIGSIIKRTDEWAEDGTYTAIRENLRTGIVIENVTTPQGVTATTVTNKDGEVMSRYVSIETKAVKAAEKAGENIVVPVSLTAVEDAKDAQTVQIDIPARRSVKVELPVENVTAGTVIVRINEDGTEETIKYTVTTDNGVAATLKEDAEVKTVNTEMPFEDIPEEHKFYPAVMWVFNNGIMKGTDLVTFARENPVSRQQVWRILARIITGEDTDGMAGAKVWAIENGISDGTRPGEAATREEFITMMWIAFGRPEADTAGLEKFSDIAGVSGDAKAAFAWAVEVGITEGYSDGTMRPAATATRGAFAAVLYRYLAQ